MLTPCRKLPPFPHANDRFIVDQGMHRFDRYDNFYNGYNADCQMLRRVCCNPFQIVRKSCRWCCGNN